MRPRFTFFWCLPLVLVMGFPALALAAGNATLYLITLATVLCYVGLVAAAFAILARKSRAPPSARQAGRQPPTARGPQGSPLSAQFPAGDHHGNEASRYGLMELKDGRRGTLAPAAAGPTIRVRLDVPLTSNPRLVRIRYTRRFSRRRLRCRL